MLSSNSNTKKSFLIFSKKTFQQSSYTWLVGENLEIREKKWWAAKGSHLWSFFRIRDFGLFIKDPELFQYSKFRDFYNSKKVSLPEKDKLPYQKNMKRYSTTIYTLLLICQPISAFVELFHSSCNACDGYNSCEDLYIKTRQGFPSDNVNNNVDVQQGNNSNDV